MAKKIIPEELDLLIQEYLTDGILTDKERQVILKRAEKMGLNRDEIDLYLDAQVQKIDQANENAARRQERKSCPHCGAAVSVLIDKCPECGQFITPESTKELEETLDKLKEALKNINKRNDIEHNRAIVERYARKARMYYGSHPKVKQLLMEVDEKLYNLNNNKNANFNSKVTSLIRKKYFLIYFLLVIIAVPFFISASGCYSMAYYCSILLWIVFVGALIWRFYLRLFDKK